MALQVLLKHKVNPLCCMASTESIVQSLFNGENIELIISPESASSSFQIIDPADAQQNAESPYQIKEGCSYEYQLKTSGYRLAEIPGVVRPSAIHPSSGRITPNIFVGTLTIDIIDSAGYRAGEFSLEVQSVKASYRSDYRFMLEQIAEKCVDLLMLYSSPVSHSFTPDQHRDSGSLYQRFAFIKAILDSSEFLEAVHRVIQSPVTSWEEYEVHADIRRAGRPRRSVCKQIEVEKNRITLPDSHPMSSVLKSVPRHIRIYRKADTLDTPENRFVKFVLSEFYRFCADVKEKISEVFSRAYKEVSTVESRLEEILAHSFIRDLSHPVSLPLNSPVLQRKEGYREIFHVWLMFELSAKLIWQGGEDVYRAGKRDVAKLYEYWLFFRLLEIMQEVFFLQPQSLKQIIVPSENGLNLTLKSGRYIPLEGFYEGPGRKIHVRFSYNRKFQKADGYPQAGSWTEQMHPDYTLSLWPEGFREKEAEEQELIVHIHFDAKYKINEFDELVSEKQEEEFDDSESKSLLTAKRVDLLKMHAYKDAIRRTAGAYVIFPGTKRVIKKGFKELLPGLGAFPVRPSGNDDGTGDLRRFIRDVLLQLQNRASRSERLSYRLFDIQNDSDTLFVQDSAPEKYSDGSRVRPPLDTGVLIGYYKGNWHYQWILKNGLYNTRINTRRGSIRIDPLTAGAEYLLLHQEGQLVTGDIWKITERGPRVFTKDKMVSTEYQNPSGDYLVYKVEKLDPSTFGGALWDIRKLSAFHGGRFSGFSFSVTLGELMIAKNDP